MFSGFQDSRLFRGTPHYPQRAKSSILTILTSHCKTTLQNHTAKPSGTAAQFHSTFRSGNPDTPTSIASHITVSSYTAALSQCHFRSIIQSIPHTLQHQEISTFRSVTHALVVSQQTHVYFYYIQKAVKFNVDFYSFCRYHVAYLRLILSESESCVTGAEMTKKNSNRATLRYYSLLLIG